jgi:thioredoxin-like negative regulator of GroEL
MLKETFPKPSVVNALKRYIPVKVDSDKHGEIAQEYGVKYLPTLFVLTAQGAPIHRATGFLSPEALLDMLETVEKRMEAIATLKEEVRMDPDNVSKTVKLAGMLTEIGRSGDAVELLEKAQPKLQMDTSSVTKADFGYTLGMAYLMEGSYGKGVTTLEQFVEEHPTHAEAERANNLIMRGKVFDAIDRVEKGDYDGARTVLTQLSKTATDTQVTEFTENLLQQLEVLGRPAPIWQVKWVTEGHTSTGELKGKVVALAFVEPLGGKNARVAENLQALQEQHGGKGLQAVAIVSSLDDGMQEANASKVNSWVKEHGIDYPVAIDRNGRSTYELYKAEQAPWVALIGRDGVVHYLGKYDEGELSSKLAALLTADA